jgi:Sybindin-like family
VVWSTTECLLVRKIISSFALAFTRLARTEGLALLNANDNLVLAGTLHSVHAITSRLSPTNISSGAHIIEAETFKMSIFLAATGWYNSPSLEDDFLSYGN